MEKFILQIIIILLFNFVVIICENIIHNDFLWLFKRTMNKNSFIYSYECIAKLLLFKNDFNVEY